VAGLLLNVLQQVLLLRPRKAVAEVCQPARTLHTCRQHALGEHVLASFPCCAFEWVASAAATACCLSPQAERTCRLPLDALCTGVAIIRVAGAPLFAAGVVLRAAVGALCTGLACLVLISFPTVCRGLPSWLLAAPGTQRDGIQLLVQLQRVILVIGCSTQPKSRECLHSRG
jgi:hypothetical protein